ncbi:MAG: hypothetical protein ACK5Q5_17560 [Planctomycetaceae bacterium]
MDRVEFITPLPPPSLAEQEGRSAFRSDHNLDIPPDRDVLVIVDEHLCRGRGIDLYYTTHLDADGKTVLRRDSWNWSTEVTFHDTENQFGLSEPQDRTTLAGGRTGLLEFLLCNLVIWWHETARESPARRSAIGATINPNQSRMCSPANG